MVEILLDVLLTTFEVSGIVFLMMVLVDFFDVRTRGKIKSLVHKSRWNEYFTASFLGTVPGCVGSYINVSMYMHGFMGIGAIASGMIATSGDEAFVMLVQFPEKAFLLFAILFVIAIPLGALLDYILKALKVEACKTCHMHAHHEQDSERNYKHYFTVHIWQHIFKKHIIRIIIWTFFSLLFVNIGIRYFSIEALVNNNIGWVILVAALVGLIPQSGPHLIFITLYASGVIPFSALLASSISQDGHGILPMLSYSVRDSAIIKSYNFLVALILGWVTFYFGF
jgi:Putative, 10TM heavy-metal exporter